MPARTHSSRWSLARRSINHLALTELLTSAQRTRIIAVILIADPENNHNSVEIDAEVTEIPFTAFKAKQVTARLIVRRVPDMNPDHQSELFTVYRYHADFTSSPLPMLEVRRIRSLCQRPVE